MALGQALCYSLWCYKDWGRGWWSTAGGLTQPPVSYGLQALEWFLYFLMFENNQEECLQN